MKPLERTRRGQKDVEFKWKYRPLEGANDRSKVERRAKEREREGTREREEDDDYGDPGKSRGRSRARPRSPEKRR